MCAKNTFLYEPVSDAAQLSPNEPCCASSEPQMVKSSLIQLGKNLGAVPISAIPSNVLRLPLQDGDWSGP